MHDRYKIEILEDFKSGVLGLWARGRDKELINRLVFLRSLHHLLIWNKSEGVGERKEEEEDEKTVWTLFFFFFWAWRGVR